MSRLGRLEQKTSDMETRESQISDFKSQCVGWNGSHPASTVIAGISPGGRPSEAISFVHTVDSRREREGITVGKVCLLFRGYASSIMVKPAVLQNSSSGAFRSP